jgi:hypothetical protein
VGFYAQHVQDYEAFTHLGAMLAEAEQ